MVESREQYDRLNNVLDGDEGGKAGEMKQLSSDVINAMALPEIL